MLTGRLLLIALGLLALTPACGEQRSARGAKSVGEVITQAARLQERPIRVAGRAFPVGRTQFVLSGRKQSIWVLAGAEVVRRIPRAGTPVVVTGRVRRLQQPQAIELADEVAELSPGRGQIAAAHRPVEILRARRNQHAPYIALEQLSVPTR